MLLKDLPPDSLPREKLLARGAGALSDAELLALLLRTGIRGKNVLQMAHELLQLQPNAEGHKGFDGVAGLLNATAADLRRVKGLGADICPPYATAKVGGWHCRRLTSE